MVGGVLLYRDDGRVRESVALPADSAAAAAAPAPAGHRFALSLVFGRRSAVYLLVGRRLKTVFAASGRFSEVDWSPDGRRLLIAWPAADQWLFVGASGPPAIHAAGGVSRQFNPGGVRRGSFPAIRGWCCSRQLR